MHRLTNGSPLAPMDVDRPFPSRMDRDREMWRDDRDRDIPMRDRDRDFHLQRDPVFGGRDRSERDRERVPGMLVHQPTPLPLG